MTETRRRYAQSNMSQNEDEESLLPSGSAESSSNWKAKRKLKDESEWDPGLVVVAVLTMILISLFGVIYWLVYVAAQVPLLKYCLLTTHRFYDSSAGLPLPVASPCDTIENGYQCTATLSHNWGQYSPYYSVPTDLSLRPPSGCKVTFAQLLSRHGARYPTSYKSNAYRETITKIKNQATNLTGPYQFLQGYSYNLGSERLTAFGEQQLINSGINFFNCYESLATASTPFIRAGDQARVVASARKWSEGFHKAKAASGADKDSAYPYPILEISEAEGMNNTLDHGLCTAFEVSTAGQAKQHAFGDTFLPDITARLKRDLSINDLHELDTLSLMDMCPFTVVATTAFSATDPATNPFCALFTQSEWEKYDYFQSLGKYYRFGPGATLGPTQGVGYVNELIARLTSSPVQDHTSVNHTLDDDAGTFPLGRALYADFSHDNDMTAIFSALGLFDGIPVLSTERAMSVEEMGGYAASRSVPFGGRAVVERLVCEDEATLVEETVRVILNGRVWPLTTCGADMNGLCTLKKFVESLNFAREGGRWDECFTVEKASRATIEALGTL